MPVSRPPKSAFSGRWQSACSRGERAGPGSRTAAGTACGRGIADPWAYDAICRRCGRTTHFARIFALGAGWRPAWRRPEKSSRRGPSRDPRRGPRPRSEPRSEAWSAAAPSEAPRVGHCAGRSSGGAASAVPVPRWPTASAVPEKTPSGALRRSQVRRHRRRPRVGRPEWGTAQVAVSVSVPRWPTASAVPKKTPSGALRRSQSQWHQVCALRAGPGGLGPGGRLAPGL